jgi:alkaline phosphatase
MKILLLFLASATSLAAHPRAKNIILFVGDAGGVPTLNAAGIYAHNRPLSLFIHSMRHVALTETSAADDWVTDSAAGMTAIMTGRKTNNGMVSQAPGQAGDVPLKTLLEYAEERGLATGVVTNMPVWDATPAVCYAHFSSRKNAGEIIAQIFRPRFGDGVDVLIGGDQKGVFEAAKKIGLDFSEALAAANYQSFATPSALTAEPNRAVALFDQGDFDPQPVVRHVIEILSRNPKGYFLMVEWDMHTNKLRAGLDRTIVMDELIRQTAATAPDDTLIIYAADHSFDLRLRKGKRGVPLVLEAAATEGATAPPQTSVRVDNSHTGEETVVAAQGPGAERVRGFLSNTDLFRIMLAAYGWTEDP